MIFYHVTLRANLLSIRRTGLNGALASGKMQVSWLCKSSKVPWAILHLHVKRGWKIEDIVVTSWSARREQLTRFRRGIYHVPSLSAESHYLGELELHEFLDTGKLDDSPACSR